MGLIRNMTLIHGSISIMERVIRSESWMLDAFIPSAHIHTVLKLVRWRTMLSNAVGCHIPAGPTYKEQQSVKSPSREHEANECKRKICLRGRVEKQEIINLGAARNTYEVRWRCARSP